VATLVSVEVQVTETERTVSPPDVSATAEKGRVWVKYIVADPGTTTTEATEAGPVADPDRQDQTAAVAATIPAASRARPLASRIAPPPHPGAPDRRPPLAIQRRRTSSP
jgi:hypothetical protein